MPVRDVAESTGLEPFHPVVQTWFREAFSEPTEAQRRAWVPIAAGQNTLLLAPTGSGKTLAAFLVALDRLMFGDRSGANGEPNLAKHDGGPSLQRGVHTLYVSPLKALGVDVERNLRTPLQGIRRVAERGAVAHHAPTVAVRTGDTSSADRQRMIKHPPDILITTPESLYLLLTSRGRDTLRSVHTVIVDEIHALVASKRGAHLFATLERLEAWRVQNGMTRPLQRVGLSATQRPLDEVAQLLGGCHVSVDADVAPQPRPVTLIEAGRRRTLELTVEVPVEDMARLGQARPIDDGDANSSGIASIWPAIHPRLVELIRQHRSTMLFVNSRRLAERLAQALNEVAEADIARAHHGSLAKDARLEIENQLKQGTLPAIVATSSLELGIDMGAVDLVIQIESPPSIAAGIQRIGRAGHQVGGVSRGMIFPKYRGDLLACSAATARMLEGDVEATYFPRNPLDVLAQQIVAMVALGTQSVSEVYRVLRGAAPFRDLPQSAYVGILDLLSGRYPATDFAELKPRIVWDRETDLLSPRRSTLRLAVLNAGTIPDRGLYGVFLEGASDKPQRVGELDEEMVFETRAGEVFLLGATSWRVTDITRDRVMVVPAPGEPGKMPFWRGDGPGRPLEFGRAIGQLTRELVAASPMVANQRLIQRHGLDPKAANNLLAYLQDQREATTQVPSDRDVVVESFLDEIGDWRVVVLSPFGTRVHAPWATAIASQLREQLQVEVESTWTDDGMVFRLPESENPPAVDAFFPASHAVEALVTQELGGTAMFAARFRENAARALLLPRQQPGKRVPLWLQRRKAADLLAAAAKYPQFPILLETYRECLRDVFDVRGLQQLLQQVEQGAIRVHAVRSDGASPFAASLLFNYAGQFIYDGDTPLAERKAQALSLDYAQLRELLGEAELRELLDAEVIAQVGLELQRLTRDIPFVSSDDLHDLLRVLGDLSLSEIQQRAGGTASEQLDSWLAELARVRRVVLLRFPAEARWIAVEDAGRYRDALGVPLPVGLPAAFLESSVGALDDLIGRYARTHAPFTAPEVAQRFGLGVAPVEQALRRLEQTQSVVQGEFLPQGQVREWCDRQVLRQLKRRSLAKLRQQIAPVDQATLGRFLPSWQWIDAPRRGLDGVLDVLEKLQGLWLSASAWEHDILPARVADFQPHWVDELCMAGEIVWQARGMPAGADCHVAFFLTDSFAKLGWIPQREEGDPLCETLQTLLQQRGALVFDELVQQTGRFSEDVKCALWDLVAAGQVTNDSLEPLRARRKDGLRAARTQVRLFRSRRQQRSSVTTPGTQGRWRWLPTAQCAQVTHTERQIAVALQMAERYGIVTREWVAQEQILGGFSGLYGIYKTLEENGRLRRGYFVEGLGGAQFAVSGAEDRLRGSAQDASGMEPTADWRILAAVDPANPYGAAIPWPPLPATTTRPQRIAGAYVILKSGQLMGYLTRTHQQVLIWVKPDDETTLDQLVHQLANWSSSRGPLLIAKINGSPSQDFPHQACWLNAGFVATSKGFLKRRSR